MYYVSAPRLDGPAQREADELATLLFARQYADWRELRFEPFTAPLVRKALAQMAARMRETFWRLLPARDGQPARRGPGQPTASTTTEAATGTVERRSVAKRGPPTHVVDPLHRGDFSSISAAIKAARPGDRILVRPGLYQESVVLDKPLEVIGQGPLDEIVVQARDADALLFKTNIGRVTNVTLRQFSGEAIRSAVDITQVVWSWKVATSAARMARASRFTVGRALGCTASIHDGNKGGVFVYDNGLGTLEDNDITANIL